MNQELTLEQAFANIQQSVALVKFTLAEGEIIKQSLTLIANILNSHLKGEAAKGNDSGAELVNKD